jgi:hypothetical protein
MLSVAGKAVVPHSTHERNGLTMNIGTLSAARAASSKGPRAALVAVLAAWLLAAMSVVPAHAAAPAPTAAGTAFAPHAAAKGRALVVGRVSAPRHGHASGRLRVMVRVRATVASRRVSRLAVFLSHDRMGDAKDLRFEETIPVPTLRARESANASAALSVPPSTDPEKYYFIVCPARGASAVARCTAAAEPTEITITAVATKELVHAAVGRGELKKDMALAYRVLASFGDPRVPARYVGDDGLLGDGASLREALDDWSQLSSRARALITPFFTPPAARGSWANGPARRAAERGARSHAVAAPGCIKEFLADSEWDSLVTGNGKVRIWWRDDQNAAEHRAKATALAGEIDRIIWPRLAGLFTPKEPLSDAGVECFKGGDGKLDIYFHRHSKARALAVPYPPRCAKVPAFLLVPPDVTNWELAHEMTHAFQFAYPYAAKCSDYTWFDEGSANWGAHWVYPADDSEHAWSWLLRAPDWSLDHHDYDSWGFGLYLEKVQDPKLIPRIYTAFGAAASLPAMNATLPGGFARAWPEFTRYAWNQEPQTSSFLRWDRLTHVPMDQRGLGGPLPVVQLALGGLEQRTLNLPAENLAYLARKYTKMVVVPGEKVHYLRFNNTLAGVPHANVQAFVKMDDGTWQTQDWTARRTVEFCWDNPGERVREIVLAYSNSDFAGKKTINPAEQPTMAVRNTCDNLPFHYRVVAFSFEERTSASQASVSCGMISGTRDVFGTTPGPTSGPPDGKLEPTGTIALTGAIHASMPTGSVMYRNQTLQGCKSNPPSYVPPRVSCSLSLPDRSVPFPRPRIELHLPAGNEMVRVYWPVTTTPGISFAGGATDGVCNVDINARVPYDETVHTYTPLSEFRKTEPFTLTNSGQVRLDKDNLNRPADVTFSWSYSITLQRVSADGGPVK